MGGLEGENVFEFVSNFTKFLASARRGITFQCVDGAANAANELLVSRAVLELQTGVVDGLQQFRGTLEKERAEFRSPILGQKGQAATSIRL